LRRVVKWLFIPRPAGSCGVDGGPRGVCEPPTREADVSRLTTR
jgi:hypothetical protein